MNENGKDKETGEGRRVDRRGWKKMKKLKGNREWTERVRERLGLAIYKRRDSKWIGRNGEELREWGVVESG